MSFMSLLFTKQVVYVRLRESKPRFYGLFAYGGSMQYKV